MKISDFDYTLPPDLIAAFPAVERTSSRLLYFNRARKSQQHTFFSNLLSFLKPGDVLVLNDTRVLPARLYGRRESGGKVEALLLKQMAADSWKALIKPSGKIKKGAKITFEKNGSCLCAVVSDDAPADSGERLLCFETENFREALDETGFMPLPPYIGRAADERDSERYQTVFADKDGAIAAPTAGLHFDQPQIQALKEAGIEIALVTLHVGYGTFQPVQFDDPLQHRMHEEFFEVSENAARIINAACREKRRVIACGTTSVRVLETAAVGPGEIAPVSGMTNIFIYPPYSFKITSGLITNFHLPKTTLLMLVAALLGNQGRETLFELYQEAIRERYRFFSYGDAMLIL